MRKVWILSVVLLILVGCTRQTQDDSKLIVGMECAYPPFNWVQTEASNFAVALDNGMYCDGYDVQIAKLIASELNRELVIHVNPIFDALLTDVQNGVIDLIIAGMTDTEERREAVDFTNIYYNTEIVVVVRKDSNLAQAKSIHDFENARVAAQTGTTHDVLIEQMNGVEHMMSLENFPTLTTNLVNNAIDAFIAENVVAEAIIETNPTLTYVQFSGDQGFALEEDMSVSIGLQKGNTALKDAINEVLSDLTQEERTEMMNDAISRQP